MIDIKTIILLIVISALTVGPVQLMAARRYQGHIGRSMQFWACGFIASGLGNLLIVLRPSIPDFYSRVVGNSLILLSFIGYNYAIRQLKQEPAHSKYYITVISLHCVFYYYFLTINDTILPRMIWSNLCLIAILLPLCRDLFVNIPPEKRSTYWSLGLLFSWIVVVLAGRIFVISTGYHSAYIELNDPAVQSFLLKSAFIVSVISGLFFMLMASDEFAAQISHLASHDPLTNIYNRRAFDERATRSLSNSRKKGKTSVLLTLDLDYFKDINDRFGHSTGDRALKSVVGAITSHLRKHDIFGRYGGEEFCILLPETTEEHALHVAERLRWAIQEVTILTDTEHPTTLTASIGLACDSNKQIGLEALFNQSDRALYDAKSKGRNQVVMCPST